jgi:FixJ family two-component response regulator/signal transduction histidine kinase
MLAELSARFINLPAEKVDGAINDALRRIAELLGVDRSQLIRFSTPGDDADITHSGAVGNAPAVPPKSLSELYPWALRLLRKGQPAVVRDVEALPTEAAVDQASFRRAGSRANLSVPLRVGGRIEGAITLGCLRAVHDWPDELVARVNVLAEVFANALAHRRAQEALDVAMRFEQLMSEIFAELLTAGRAEQDRVIETGLRDVARTFGAECATLWRRVADRDEFTKTHRWVADGVSPRPDRIADDALPWIDAQLVAGEVVRFARHADLPPEAVKDAASLDALGIRAAVAVPLTLSGDVVGALSFGNASAERPWADALMPRVKLLGEVFASVFAREAAERREQEAQAQAAHAARVGTMGMFAASLVHELTQPLAASLANAETAADLLATAVPDLDELRAAVADIVTDDRRVGELIQQLRRFLRRGETEWSELDIGDMIHDNLRLVAGDAAEKEIAIKLDLAEALPAFIGNRVQLQQVMLNLLLNALDAVKEREAGSRHVTVLARATDTGVRIEVSDTGRGMDEATVARVFQPFFTTKQGGMGLGLSISRSIVAAHGGRLSLESTPQGTTFRLDLPLRPRAATQSAPRAATPEVTGIVYVIDDDPSMRRALERQLQSADYRVECFESAQAFLDRPPRTGVACILSDVRMPGLSGLDLQASLAKSELGLPIVFISAHSDVSTTVYALKSGAINFLAKPFTKGALLAAVAEALAQSRDIASDHAKSSALRARHDALTPREREVFELVAQGILNKIIADRLGAAEATIKIHRGRVMEKMGAASAADLVRMAEMLNVARRSALK